MTGTATTMGAYIRGLDAFPATVRASIEDGLPGLFVEGSGNPTEMRERVRCAIKMSGFAMPERGRIRIIMEPSLVLNSVPSTLDLAVAVAILAASGQIAPEYCEKRLFSARSTSQAKYRPGEVSIAHRSWPQRRGTSS